MNKICNLISSAIAGVRKDRLDINGGDYIGPDGLIYCGKCQTPKEYRLIMPDSGTQANVEFLCPIMCRCREEEKKREEMMAAKQEAVERLRKLKNSSLMAHKFWNSTFASCETIESNARNIRICKRYAEKFNEMFDKNQGLLFWGNVGTGKTYLAACICNYLLERLVPVVMTSFVKLLQNMQPFRNGADEELLVRRLNSAKLLIIDDLGAERGTDFALEKVYDIVDSRYRAGKPMILTTNMTLDQMKSASDIRYARIYDRIFEVCFPLAFTGESWRRQEAADRYEEMSLLLEGAQYDGD